MRGLFGNVGAIYGRGPDSVKDGVLDGVLDYQDVRLGMPSLRGSPERVRRRPRWGALLCCRVIAGDGQSRRDDPHLANQNVRETFCNLRTTLR